MRQFRSSLQPPLSNRGTILRAHLKIRREGGMIVLSQKTRLWFRLSVCLWALVVLITPFMLYDEIANTHTTHFTCDRASGICAVEGNPNNLPRLADITRAVMDHDFNRRDGANWGITLVTSDGKKYAIEQQRAIKDSVIADYRRTAKAINAFLADPGQQKLDVSFTYRAGISEIIKTIFYLIFGIVTLALGLFLWTRRTYTFEPGKLTVTVRGPILRQIEEITNDGITAIVDHTVTAGRRLDLNLADSSSLQVLQEGINENSTVSSLAKELAALLGKPLESAVR
jgi:hypothetical protein